MNTVLAELRASADVTNAREHGLKGDGHTNDQPALAALVERLGRAYERDRRPRVIYCPPGEYLMCDATTTWHSGLSLIGAGAGPTRFVLNNAGAVREPLALARFTEQQHGASRTHALFDCAFASFEIDGSLVMLEEYTPHAKGLDLQFMVRATFHDLYIHDTAATGLGCDHLQDTLIEDVIAERCGRLNDGDQPGGAGIGLGIGGWGGVERCSLNDCIAISNATNGIFLELQPGKGPPPRGFKITGGHCVGNLHGISDWGADGLTVSACVMCDNREVGFDVSGKGTSKQGGSGGLLTGCVIDGNGRDGVSIGDTEGRYVVRGNRISRNHRNGYRQQNLRTESPVARDMVVEGNEIWSNGHGGISIHAPVHDATILGNRLRDNGRNCAGIHIAARTTHAWIRNNRIWDSGSTAAPARTVLIEPDACEACRIEDNGP